MQSEIPIQNLRLLIGQSTSLGSPSSKNFCAELTKAGYPIKAAQLSDWLMGQDKLMPWDARKIEDGASVPAGWLNEDLEFVFRASPELLGTFRTIAQLPIDVRNALSILLRTLAAEK